MWEMSILAGQVCAQLTHDCFRRGDQDLVGNSISTPGSFGSENLMSLVTDSGRRGLYNSISWASDKLLVFLFVKEEIGLGYF